jgi:hypothetical protein
LAEDLDLLLDIVDLVLGAFQVDDLDGHGERCPSVVPAISAVAQVQLTPCTPRQSCPCLASAELGSSLPIRFCLT